MKKPVLIEGQEVTLATITVGDLETVDLSAKTGRKFNIAMIAASILAAGDQERGTEAWVRTVHAFDPEGGDAPRRGEHRREFGPAIRREQHVGVEARR